MTQAEATEIVSNCNNATKTGAYLDWTLDDLLGMQMKLRQARDLLLRFGYYLETADETLAKLNQRIETKQFEERTERHHSESMNQGKHTLDVGEKTLFWARWAVIAAVLVPILVALIADIPFSKLLPATRYQSSGKLTVKKRQIISASVRARMRSAGHHGMHVIEEW